MIEFFMWVKVNFMKVVKLFKFSSKIIRTNSLKKQPSSCVLRKRCSENSYAANLQKNTHGKVRFQKSCFATLLKSHLGMGVLL